LQDPNPEIHENLARADFDAAPVSEAERALLRFVKRVTESAYRTTDADVEALRAAGWTDPQIAECVYITALFAFFNRVADAFGLEDPHYFSNPPPRGGDRAVPPPGEREGPAP
jgi:alkylhydroperoxidase family enzyme